MSRPILLLCLCLGALLAPAWASARVAQLRAERVTTSVGTLAQVRLRLDWPQGAARGELQLWVGRLDAPDLGYRGRDLHWRCPLARTPAGGWRCEGVLLAGGTRPLRLAVALEPATTRATLSQGGARLALVRTVAVPDLTTFDLRAVPLAWAQALLAQAWPAGRLKAGTLDGRLQLATPARGPLRVEGPLHLRGAGFENADASIVGEGLRADLQVDYRSTSAATRASVAGALLGGEFLAGNTYVALPATPVGLEIEARQSAGAGWSLPRLAWRDGDVLAAEGTAALSEAGDLDALDVRVRSDDMTPLRTRYLSGWMGLVGLGNVDLHGAMGLEARVASGRLSNVDAHLQGVDLRDPDGRFVFDGLRGHLRYSAGAPVTSALQWDGGQLYGLAFGAARLPFASAAGALRVDGAVDMPMLGGRLGLRDVIIRPPLDGAGADIRFGMHLAGIDFGKVSQALGLPPFQGRLDGDLPHVHYANDRIDFDGGLSLGLFDGRVAFSSLALERPFGTAPSLSADVAMDDLDLLRLTEVLGFGSITGRLDGRITGLRLVDWTPVMFDARFVTDGDGKRGVPQRISQRAVQDISSVGDASFVTSLQGKLIGLFSDFGYRRIGIGCRLENQICTMSGLRSAGNAFTIVEGKGIPRLDVVGFNRAVDWPTLVERLTAAGRGDTAPVVN